MARQGLLARLRKLELRRSARGPSRVLVYRCGDFLGGPIRDDLPVWLDGCYLPGESPTRGLLASFSGPFMLIQEDMPFEGWEAMAARQQHVLLTVAESRTNAAATLVCLL